MALPRSRIVEEGMREGMQIESADISVDDKVRLLDALSATGLETIVVGSFVSPKWTPQMADIDEVVRRGSTRRQGFAIPRWRSTSAVGNACASSFPP